MSTLKLTTASGGGTVSLTAPASTTSNAQVTLTLPANDGDADQFLKTNGSGALSFATVSSDPTTTSGTNNFTVADGDLVIGTAGHGIDFSATANGPMLSHASELFDDYEEGTFDVAFNGNVAGNTGQNKAQYVKIGRVCHIAGQVHLDSSGNTDNVEINNLPFASAHSHGEGSGQQHVLGGSSGLNHDSDTISVRWYIGDNTQTAKLIDMRDNAGYSQVAAVASKYVWMAMTYITE
tara:strand:- start:282 stop:989 length:708 start_codon:yes stop_codon:yes gene_type:complete